MTQHPHTTDDGAPSGPRTAYLTSHYPALSHSFILREIEALRSQGVDVSTYTVHRSPRVDMRTEAMRREDDATTAIISGNKVGIAKAVGRFARRHPRELLGAAGRAVRTGYPSPKARLWQMFYLAEAVTLHEQLERQGVRHIHAHHANVASDVARLTVDLGNRLDGEGTWSWSFTLHGPTEFDDVREHDLPAKMADASGVSVISDFARSQAMRHLDPEHWEHLHIVHMSVDPEVFEPPADGREHDGPLRLLSVGRLHPAKGFHVLIDAAAALRDRGVEVDVRIVGQGDLHDELQARIDRRGLGDTVTLVGPLGEDDIVRELHRCDVFVSSSFSEGLPVVLMEALATEAPVVATRIAAVPELVTDGVVGRVVAPSNVGELADAIAQLAADPEGRREMGRRGREAVLSGFTIETVGPPMAEFIRDASGSGERPRD